ncbi:MAG TPA: sigma 54-interacting transcriptional regulator [Kofleriaceae bacterium]|nr:sigma 54-interacting transcriptional regulator [Kofleriaceae bacterium]
MHDPVSIVGYRILVSGRDANTSEVVLGELQRLGYDAVKNGDATGCTSMLEQSGFDGAVICAEGIDDLDAIRDISINQPAVPLIVVAAEQLHAGAVSAGADELVSQPVTSSGLSLAVGHALSHSAHAPAPSGSIVGESSAMMNVRHSIAQVSGCDAGALVTGEEGTGKRLIAHALHCSSRRAGGPFVVFDSSTVTSETVESSLFAPIDGALARAHRGTLVIAEPATLRPEVQAGLLQALAERKSSGGDRPSQVDVRVVSTSQRNLQHAVALEDFDSELFALLATTTIALPPLRERGYDILQLADHFARLAASAAGKQIPRISAASSRYLLAYTWPGNVRELKQCIEHAVESAERGVIDVDDLPERVIQAQPERPEGPQAGMPTLDDLERRYINEVLAAVGGNKSRASRVLGVDRRTLYRKLQKLG